MLREPSTIFTIGHSNHSLDDFARLLRANGVDTVVDVRSQPFSKIHTQFNRRPLAEHLGQAGISYAYLGDELGGRPGSPSYYDDDGYVRYDQWSQSEAFRRGIARLLNSVNRHCLALLCSEEDPAKCHRHLLIARELSSRGWPLDRILHIRASGAPTPASSIPQQASLDGVTGWRSPQSVLHKVQPSISSSA